MRRRTHSSAQPMTPALPIELWCMAWTWLPLDDRVSVSQVCRSWRYVSLGTSQLWSRIDVYSSGLPDSGCACAGCSWGDEDAPMRPPSFLPADYSCCLLNTNLCSVVLALQRCGTQPILLSIEGLTAEDYDWTSCAAYDSDDESDHTIRCLVKILAPYIPRISWMHFRPRDYKAFTKFLYLCLRYCRSEDCSNFDSMRELIISSSYDENNRHIVLPWLEFFDFAFHRLERIKLGFGCYWALHAADWQPPEPDPEDGPIEFLPELKELHYTYYEPRNCVDVLAGFPGLSSAHLMCDCDYVDSDAESDAWGDISSLRMRAAHVPVIHLSRIQDEETARLMSTIFGGTDRQELVLRYEEIEPWWQLYDIFADLGTELNATVSLSAKTLTIHAQDAARVRTVEMPITGDGVTHRAIWTSISPSLVRRLAIPLNVWYITVPVLASLPVLDCLILRFVDSRDRKTASRQRFVCATTMPALRVLVLEGHPQKSHPDAFDVPQSVVEKIALSLNSDDRHGGSRLSRVRVLNLEVVGFDPEAVARATGASVQQMWDSGYSTSSDVFLLGDDNGPEYSPAQA